MPLKNKSNNSKLNYMETKVDVLKDGPLMVHGSLTVTKPNGELEKKESTTAFCRCGASTNKPYCDGAHRKVDFKG